MILYQIEVYPWREVTSFQCSPRLTVYVDCRCFSLPALPCNPFLLYTRSPLPCPPHLLQQSSPKLPPPPSCPDRIVDRCRPARVGEVTPSAQITEGTQKRRIKDGSSALFQKEVKSRSSSGRVFPRKHCLYISAITGGIYIARVMRSGEPPNLFGCST
jgi:hypothetical protein